jgi:agmatinase
MITFAKLPKADLDRLNDVTGAILGISEATPYKLGRPSHSANAPAALREASNGFAGQLRQLDFDLGRPLFGEQGETFGMVDCGDIPTNASDPEGNRARITAGIRSILQAGAIPIVLGGDDSVPIPVLQAYEGRGPYTILQIDAHADWGDVIQGNPLGFGSPMRRASEMPWITGMVQIGMRGLGSGDAWQIRDARAWGSQLVESSRFHADGVDTALATIEPGSEVLISIDCDGLDPAVLPAVNMPTPGGLTYEDMMAILHGVAARARIAGCILTELVPERDDPYKLSTLTAARVVSVALGLLRGTARTDANAALAREA